MTALFAAALQQRHDAVEHRLVDQVDPQAVGAAPAEEFDHEVFSREVGQEASFFFVEQRSNAAAHQKPAKAREQREEIAGGEAGGGQSQREQPCRFHGEGHKPPADAPEGEAEDGSGPQGQLSQQRPQHHAHAQQVQDAEIDDDELIRHVQQVHTRRDHGDDHAAAKDLQAPADAALADGGADAGEHHKGHAEVIHAVLQRRIFDHIDAQKVIQVKAQVDKHDDQYHHAPRGVQFPDSGGFCHGITSL